MTKLERKFVLEHVFNNVSEMEEEERKFSDMEMHFGIPWRICVKKEADHLAAYLYCEPDEKGEWSVETEHSFKIGSPLRKMTEHRMGPYSFKKAKGWGTTNLVSWADMQDNYIEDNKILLKCHVTIKNITGIAGVETNKRLRNFDESMGDLSDVVLKVGDEKFHVSRMVLASFSSYFKTLFFGKFDEAKKSEIELKDIDLTEFQDFLEMIYGESDINDENVEGLLKLSEMYDVPTVMRKCEEYLLNTSKIIEKKKLLLSSQFNLENLANSFIEKAKTVKDVRSLVSTNIDELNPSVIREMFRKLLEITKNQ